MPITPAHAVVALPFVRTPLVPAAIAIGAMTPDLPLYLRVGPGYWVTHSWWAVLPVDLPLALGLLLVWRVILRPAVPELLPAWYARRVPGTWSDGGSGWREIWSRGRGSVRRSILLLVSLALGVATHIVWDSFTHEGRWGSKLFPALSENVAGRPGWEWVALVSSVAGIAAIALWLQLWVARQSARDVTYRTPRWVRATAIAILPASLVIAGILVMLLRGTPKSSEWILFLERSATTGAAIALISLTVVAAGIRVSLARHARDAA